MGEGQRPEQNTIDEAVNGRVGAEAESEGEDGDQREAGAFSHGAEGEAEVGGEIGHEGALHESRLPAREPVRWKYWVGRGRLLAEDWFSFDGDALEPRARFQKLA